MRVWVPKGVAEAGEVDLEEIGMDQATRPWYPNGGLGYSDTQKA